MLAAEAVHEFIRPLLAPLAEVKDSAVRQALDSMAADGRAALAVEGYGEGAVQLRTAADVRYLGQSSQLTVPMPAGPFNAAALHRAFERIYRETFGYVAEGEPIELVNLRLSAIGTAATRLDFGGLSLDARALAGESGERLVSFERGKPRIKARLLPRAAVEQGPVAGPAIIESYDTTIVVPPGCTARAAGAGSIAIEMEETIPEAVTAPGTSVGDPITFAVIKNAMDAIVDEVAYTVIRTARSEIVKDVMDYSAAICDAKGEMVAQAKTIAQHLGAIPEAMSAVQAKWGGKLSPGDAVIMNDPYCGGMHLPDIFMFFPIFDGAEILAWSVVICHHTDVGGRVPGSNAADSTEIYQEGLRIPPLKLFHAGVMDETLEQLIGLNVRVPDRVIGDLRAQYAACQVGAREIARLVARYGAAGMRGYFAALLDYAERMARAEIATWPQGTWRFTDHIDSDGLSDDPVPLTVAVTVRGDGTLQVDWAGSSKQVRAAINSTLSFTKSNTFLSVRCALKGDIPNNAGVFRCIEVTAPEGSVLNPIAPAPVAARALTGYRVMDTMFGALAQIVPHVVPAAGEGGNTVVCLGGRHPDNKPFIIVDMISGCWGGRPDQDGIEAITNPSQNLSNTPVEVLERQHPVRIEDTPAARGASAAAWGCAAPIGSLPTRPSCSFAPTG
jgi:N-methylhydantoinase B